MNTKHALFLEAIGLMRQAGGLQVNGRAYTLRDFRDINDPKAGFCLDPVDNGTQHHGYLLLRQQDTPLVHVLGPRMVLKAWRAVGGDRATEPMTIYVDLDLRPLAVEWINHYGYATHPNYNTPL